MYKIPILSKCELGTGQAKNFTGRFGPGQKILASGRARNFLKNVLKQKHFRAIFVVKCGFCLVKPSIFRVELGQNLY